MWTIFHSFLLLDPAEPDKSRGRIIPVTSSVLIDKNKVFKLFQPVEKLWALMQVAMSGKGR